MFALAAALALSACHGFAIKLEGPEQTHAVSRCGHGRYCESHEKCVTTEKGAGLKNGCVPWGNKACSDTRFSCPENTTCVDETGECEVGGGKRHKMVLNDRVHKKRVRSDLRENGGRCGLINQLNLPSQCVCTDHEADGNGNVDGMNVVCTVQLVGLQPFSVGLDFTLCGSPSLQVNLKEAGNNFQYQISLIGSEMRSVPIPGARVRVQDSIDLMLYLDFAWQATVTGIQAEAGVNMCGKIGTANECLSDITSQLPNFPFKGAIVPFKILGLSINPLQIPCPAAPMALLLSNTTLSV